MENGFEDEDTALHQSAKKGHPEIANVLLTAGAGVESKTGVHKWNLKAGQKKLFVIMEGQKLSCYWVILLDTPNFALYGPN